jgi:hypothetical protein
LNPPLFAVDFVVKSTFVVVCVPESVWVCVRGREEEGKGERAKNKEENETNRCGIGWDLTDLDALLCDLLFSVLEFVDVQFRQVLEHCKDRKEGVE